MLQLCVSIQERDQEEQAVFQSNTELLKKSAKVTTCYRSNAFHGSCVYAYIEYLYPALLKGVLIIADPNSIYLETLNLTREFGTTLKLGPNITPTYYYVIVRDLPGGSL